MPIELSTQLIHASIAQVLQSIDPNAEIFDNPTQQGSPYPAWYIVHRQPVERQREVGNRYVLVYYIDIWYMLKQNITRLYDQYTVVAEQLEERMEHLPIYGYEGVVVHTYDNSWGLELNAMKYSITLRLRCSRNTAPVEKMRVIEDLQVFIKGLGLLKKVHYICSQFPQFDMGIEQVEYVYQGKDITLPIVSGIYWDSDGTAWVPKAWTLGAFGESVGPIYEDVTTDLLWAHPSFFIVFDNENNRILYELQDMQDMEFTGTDHAALQDAGEVVETGTGHVALQDAGEVVFVEGSEPEPEYLDVFFYFSQNSYSSTDNGVTFAANDYWSSLVIDSADKNILTGFGVGLDDVDTAYGRQYIVSAASLNDFSFTPIGLYSGVRTGERDVDMSNFYCGIYASATAGSPYSGVCIWSRNAYNLVCKTWKCRITRINGGN